MFKPKPPTLVILKACLNLGSRLNGIAISVFILLLLLGTGLAAVTTVLKPAPAAAVTQNTINFQARLQTSTGSLVADGYYNVQFKLYDAPTVGTNLWTESYLYNSGSPDQRVRIQNGYLSVPLGSLTSFPSTINWDQQLYLTMNIGGTGTTATYDGEMTPRLALTAVPYAFRAGQLATSNAAGTLTSTLAINAPTGGSQTFQIADQGAAGTYTLLTNTNGVQLQAASPGTQQTGNINVSGTGIFGSKLQTPTVDTIVAGTLTLGGTNATAITLGDSTTLSAGMSLSFAAGAGIFNQSLSTGTFATGTGAVSLNGNVTVATGKTFSAPQLTSTVTTGTAPLVVASTTKVTNLNADLLDGLDSTAFATSTGSGSYIQNGTSQQTSSNFNISGAGTIGTNLTVAGTGSYGGAVTTTAGGAAGAGTQQLATGAYIQSRGENLVTNGTALLGNNYNFSSFVLDTVNTPSGGGSFKNSTYTSTVLTDELMPVDPTQYYKLSAQVEATTYVAGLRHYVGIAGYDIDGNSITAANIMYQTGTTTTLASPLNPGDTTVTLTSAANWNNAAGANTYNRTLMFWNYTNTKGYTYPVGTYSRNIYADYYADGGINFGTNTITLRTPWAGGAVPAGTSLSNGSSGSSYKYVAANNELTQPTWVTDQGIIGGIDLTGTNRTNQFAPGTAFVKVLFLLNRNVTGGTTNVANISLSNNTSQNVTQYKPVANYDDSTTYFQVQNSAGASIFGVDTVAGGVNIGGALNVQSGGLSVHGGLNNYSGGITNAGAISGVTTLATSGNITSTGSITGASLVVGNTANQVVTISAGAGSHGVEIGRTDGTTSTPFLDFHSGTTATDYDARIIASGGTGTSGGGALTLTAGTTNVSGNLQTGGTQRLSSAGVLGNITGYTQTVGNATFNQNAADQLKVVALQAPTSDMVNISNAGQLVTTAGTNGLQVDFYGGAAAVEASAARFNITPGTTTGGTWNALRVVAGTATSGVSSNGVKLETTAGTGIQNGLYFGTGWDSLINYNGTTILDGTGILQSAAFTGTYAGAVTMSNASNSFTGVGTGLTALNATNLGSGTVNTARLAGSYTGITAVGTLTSLTVSGGFNNSSGGIIGAGSISGASTITASGNVQASTFTSTVATGTAPLAVTSTTKVTNLNADLLDGLDSTAFATSSSSTSYIQNTVTPQTADFSITGNGTVGGSLSVNTLSATGIVSITNATAATLATSSTYALQIGQGTGGLLALGGDTNGSYIQSFSSKPLFINGQGNNVYFSGAGSVGIGQSSAGYKLDVNGDVNVASGSTYRIGGATICTVTGCLASGSSTSFINNTASTQSANFNVQSASTGTVAGVLQGAVGQTADIFDVLTSGSSKVLAVTTTGVSTTGTLTSGGALTVSAGGASISGGLNNNSGGITAAGSIAGATTLTASGNIQASTFTSTVATGTAPLTVTSTTKVTNLNADQLDGLDSTAFALATGSGNYIQNGVAVQSGANFNISGNGVIGGSLSLTGGLNNNSGGITNAGAISGVNSYIQSSGSATFNQSASNQLKVIATGVPSANMVNITNSGQLVTTAGISGLQIDYFGGAAAVESSAAKVNLTPGTTTGGTWSALRVSAGATATGVVSNGVKLETTAGTGTQNALYFGTGWNNLLNYNGASIINGTGILQSAAFTGTYAGAVTLSSASNNFTGVGTSLTALNATNLGSGTVNTARVAGAYTGITSVGTLASLAVTGAVTGGTYNGQTISSAASFTGTLTLAGVTSTTAFRVLNASSVAMLTVNTTNSIVYVGPSGGDTTGALLVLGVKTNAGDPTGQSGAMYYNSSLGKFRCYEASVWRNCITYPQVTRYTISGNKNIPNMVDTFIPFDTTVWNEAPVTYSAGVITVTQAGLYTFSGGARYYASGGGGERYIALQGPGGTLYAISNAYPGALFGSLNATANIRLSAGDTLAVDTYQSSGGTLAVDPWAGGTFMSVTRIGD